MELNREAHRMSGQWHKVVALLMRRFKLTEVKFTTAELDELGRTPQAVAFDTHGQDILVIKMIPMADALKLAKPQGGVQ